MTIPNVGREDISLKGTVEVGDAAYRDQPLLYGVVRLRLAQ